MAADVTIFAALFAGLVSFLSPCVLPLVPPYLVYLAGTSLERLAEAEPPPLVKRDTVIAAALFVAGFSTVFVALGASASMIGALMRLYSNELAIIAGILVMLYGGNSLTGAMNQALDGGLAGRERLEQLHRRAVGLNVFVTLVCLSLLVAVAMRPAPRTSGIIEVMPAQRVRYDAAMNESAGKTKPSARLTPPPAPPAPAAPRPPGAAVIPDKAPPRVMPSGRVAIQAPAVVGPPDSATPLPDDPLAVVHHMDAWMPERIATFKVRGFIDDAGEMQAAE